MNKRSFFAVLKNRKVLALVIAAVLVIVLVVTYLLLAIPRASDYESAYNQLTELSGQITKLRGHIDDYNSQVSDYKSTDQAVSDIAGVNNDINDLLATLSKNKAITHDKSARALFDDMRKDYSEQYDGLNKSIKNTDKLVELRSIIDGMSLDPSSDESISSVREKATTMKGLVNDLDDNSGSIHKFINSVSPLIDSLSKISVGGDNTGAISSYIDLTSMGDITTVSVPQSAIFDGVISNINEIRDLVRNAK